MVNHESGVLVDGLSLRLLAVNVNYNNYNNRNSLNVNTDIRQGNDAQMASAYVLGLMVIT